MSLRRGVTAAARYRPNYGLGDLRGDVMGGTAAAGLTLPVAIGYGVLSGLGPVAGLHGAIAVGIFASLFGGTKGLVYGPNIAIAITMAVVVSEYADSLPEAATIGILAGLIQIIFGLLGLGRYASYIPISLTSGFFTAFGVLIIVKQSFPAVGINTPQGSVITDIKSWPEALTNVNFDALALTVICIMLALLWRGRLLRLSPALFVVLIVGVLAGALVFRGAPTVGKIPSGLPSLQLSAISPNFFLRALQPAFIMALLGSVSTFILALRVDAITGTQHKPTREMFGQGIGNVAAGLTGGMTGSVGPGSLINILSGGRSPVAGLTVVVIILAAVLFLGPVAEQIPFAVLAAVLMVTAWNIIDWRIIRRVHRISRSFAIVMLLTIGLVLFVDIVTAIVVGLVVATLMGSRQLESLETAALVSVPLLDRAVLEDDGWDDEADPFRARTGLVVFPDRVTVASARELSRILRPDIRDHQFSIFDLSRTVYVDDSAAMIIGELINTAATIRSRTIILAGMSPAVSSTLHSMGLLDHIPKENFAADREEAREIIRPMLRQHM